MAAVLNLAGLGQVTIDRRPDICPICQTRITPNLMAGGPSGRFYGSNLTVVFVCPSDSCREYFLGYFEKRNHSYAYQTCRPSEPVLPPLPDFVLGLSQNYGDMYTECVKAEALGLKQLSGVGYRKALEFLIKDYLISRRPQDRDAIRDKPLAGCIETYVSDRNIRDVARRAIWLGNDETHYQRSWQDKDLRDLKAVLELVLRWIETEHLTEVLLKTMASADMDRVGPRGLGLAPSSAAASVLEGALPSLSD